MFRCLVAGVMLMGALNVGAAPPVLHSYALVGEDASLKIRGKKVHLYGIYIPPTGRQCRTKIRPIKCMSRAALALDFRIQGFVRCVEQRRHRDRSITALCTDDEGQDLSEYLVSQGWALALDDAPFAYHALEKIARQRNMGVWGYQADVITR